MPDNFQNNAGGGGQPLFGKSHPNLLVGCFPYERCILRPSGQPTKLTLVSAPQRICSDLMIQPAKTQLFTQKLRYETSKKLEFLKSTVPPKK